MSLTRILQGAPGTLTEQFYEDGVAVDPGVVTIQIDREDGTNLVAGGTATSGNGTAARTFNATTTHTASLDVLKVTWTSPTKGTRTEYVEVVGGFLFSLTEARALKPLDNATTYPTADLANARTLAEIALEDACKVAFVPRYARETRNGNGRCDILPRHPYPLSLTTVTISGTVYTDALIDDDRGAVAAKLYRPGGWTWGRRNIVIKYTHGYPFPPPRVGRAALLLTKRFLVDSPINDRATSIVNPETGQTQWLVTAGVRDAVFDIPEANAVVRRYGVEAWN